MKPLALNEIIEERKEKAIDNLSDSYARNRLPLEEYERLAEYINKIESERELEIVEKIVAGYGAERSFEKEPPKGVCYDDEDEQEISCRPPDNNLTILSSRKFQGPLKTGSQFISILGDAKIEVRKTNLGKRQTVLNLVSILGDNVVFVEPGIRVICKAMPVLGSTGVNQKVEKMARDGEPELIISGAALLGDISVKPLKE